MKSRVLLGVLFHETHTFLPQPTAWKDFAVKVGPEILAQEGDESPTAGFLEEARRFDWEVIPTVDARAVPSGPVEDEAFEIYWKEFEQRARPALAAGVDAIFLVLHGAMCTHSIADVEGELLARVRSLPGAAALPLFGVLDLHGNITSRMCALANGLVAYRKNPHTDAKATAVRAAGLLHRCLISRQIPHMHWCRVPVLWAPPGTGTHSDPMLALTSRAVKVEQADPDLWACNVMAGFSFADTPEAGVTLSLITVGGAERARAGLQGLAEFAWEMREKGVVTYPSVEAILNKIGPAPVGPVLLVEPADNIGAGAPGDGTGILRALLDHRVESGLLCLNDPGAVKQLAQIPLNHTIRLAIGGRGWKLDAGPVELDLTLVSRGSGAFELEDLHSHLASMNGARFDMGPCAVVRHAGLTILLTSKKTPPFDLGQYSSQGVNPRNFAIIGVKAAVAHRQAYDPIARASYFVETPGPCSSNLGTFPYQRLKHPVFPLDAITEPTFLFA